MAEVRGTVVSVKKQWWLKVNTKSIRMGALDGAKFPHVIKVAYDVDGKTYFKRKWLWINMPVPAVNDTVLVRFDDQNPKKAKVFCNPVNKVESK